MGVQESRSLRVAEAVSLDSCSGAKAQYAEELTRKLAGARTESALPVAGKVRPAAGPESKSPFAAALLEDWEKRELEA
jgi:hypothetical protein